MRWSLVAAGCVVFAIAAVTGCQTLVSLVEPKAVNEGVARYKEEFVKGPLPDFVVGVWKEKGVDANLPDSRCAESRGCWGFTFEPDGSIPRMKHNFITVPVDVNEGGVFEDIGRGVSGIDVLGPCGASYNAARRELKVRVVIDYYRIETPVEVLEGSIDDVIVGTISDGGRVWNAKWWNYTQIEGEDKLDPNEVEPISVTLYKEEKQPGKHGQ